MHSIPAIFAQQVMAGFPKENYISPQALPAFKSKRSLIVPFVLSDCNKDNNETKELSSQ